MHAFQPISEKEKYLLLRTFVETIEIHILNMLLKMWNNRFISMKSMEELDRKKSAVPPTGGRIEKAALLSFVMTEGQPFLAYYP